MKLTAREVEMIKDIPRIRTSRVRAAWSGLITAVALLAGVLYFEYQAETLGMLLAVFVGFSIGNLANAYLARHPNDKLVDLLLRYVDEDSEALAQLYGDVRSPPAAHHHPERVSGIDG